MRAVIPLALFAAAVWGGPGDPDLIVVNAKVTTLDGTRPEAEAFAVVDGRFAVVGGREKVLPYAGEHTPVVDAGGRRVIPGLNDSHLHAVRGGRFYNLELRWDGVPSLADAMRLLREQVARTPQGQWVRVVGGFAELQFAERRLPTLDELNAAAPDTPVFILHLYDRALLNRAALRAVGYGKDTPTPPGGIIERDRDGNPTGLLVADPNAWILYKTLSLGPKLPPEHQMNSTRHFMRELNRLGITSATDVSPVSKAAHKNWRSLVSRELVNRCVSSETVYHTSCGGSRHEGIGRRAVDHECMYRAAEEPDQNAGPDCGRGSASESRELGGVRPFAG